MVLPLPHVRILSHFNSLKLKKQLHALVLALLFFVPDIVYGQAPNIGSAANFVLFSSVGAVTNTGISQITGNVGTNVGSSTGFGNVNGVMDDQNGASLLCASDLSIAYTELDTATPNFFISTAMGNNDTLVSGVYNVPGASTLNASLILDGQGNAGAVFIFQVQGALSVGALSKVILINGAQACNVFWKVEGLISVATGSTMRGTYIAHNAAISLNALDTLEGRALAIAGAVTIDGLMAYTPLGCGTPLLQGPAAPNLLSTKYYGLFSTDGPVTNTGITHVVGDVGTNVGLTTGFDPLLVTGMIHPIPDASTAQCASDLTLVYDYLEGLTFDIQLLYPAQFGNNLVLTPHTYLLNAATALTDSLYLNAEGNSNAIFVIQINGALSASSFSKVILINGARSSNVYWKVDGAVTIADSAIFCGTLIVNNAAILFNLGTLLNGRALTTTGAVTINGSNIIGFTAPDSGAITGSSNVCIGSSITLADNTSSSPGIWSISNPKATITDSGIVTGVSAGIDTVKFTVTDSFGTTATTTIITVNPLPFAGTISGGSNVCLTADLVLTDLVLGGTWRSTNALATVSSGTVTPVSTGVDTIQYIVTNFCGNDTAKKVVTIGALPVAGIITGSSSVCMGTELVLSDLTTGGIWSSSNATASVVTGTVTPVAPGLDTIRYTVSNTCGSDTAVKSITIIPLPNAGTIFGGSSVCMGNNLLLGDLTLAGVWSCSNTNATIIAGLISPVAVGIDTVRYIFSNTCGSDTAEKIITIATSPTAGTILGGTALCMGGQLVLNDATIGGNWGSSNTIATVTSGTVTPVSSGIDTISYVVNNTCGTDTAFKIVTITALPDAGTITGLNQVCLASLLLVNDIKAGGVWSMSNSSASIVLGTVTPHTIGFDTIRYIMTNMCGIDTAVLGISILTAPVVNAIVGNSFVCFGLTTTLNDLTPGGSWSAANASISVISGVLTGNAPGTDTIYYRVSNLCGSDSATAIISVNPLPNAGVISGDSTVCPGSNISLTESVATGTWSLSNSNATITGNIVTGNTPGFDTIRYLDTNLCGTDFAQKMITINPLPSAGTLTGPSAVCIGATITINTSSPGGSWETTNGHASLVDSLISGISSGIDTIWYTVSNSCGNDTAVRIVNVLFLPPAGALAGATSACIGTPVLLTPDSTGGVWSTTNLNGTVVGGLFSGLTTGIDTVLYIVNYFCGNDTSTLVMNIGTLPIVASIIGPSTVCVGSLIILTDDSTGGTWTSDNVVDTVASGIVFGVAPGTDSIVYAITNGCGTTKVAKSITVNPLPFAGTIVGASRVCVGMQIVLTDTITGGVWISDSVNDTVQAGVVFGLVAGPDTIGYVVSNSCGFDTAIIPITVMPLPVAGTIVGANSVCISSSIMLTDTTLAGVWSSTNAHASVSAGMIVGLSAGTDTIRYEVTNFCGTDTVAHIVAVNPLPEAAPITTQSPGSLCSGTMYQNFGTSTPPPAGVEYSWSATNATVWATSYNGQNALISFIDPGTATILLTDRITATQCRTQLSTSVTVGNATSQTPSVIYFQYHFVCLPSNEDSYQWGYDDATTLDSSLLVGEVNQDYLNTNPDFANKFYWVMTTYGGCSQKTYLTVPTSITNVNATETTLDVFPNPATEQINIVVNSAFGGEMQMEVANIAGQKAATSITKNHKSVVDVTNLPAGFYIINCYYNGSRLASTRFVKN